MNIYHKCDDAFSSDIFRLIMGRFHCIYKSECPITLLIFQTFIKSEGIGLYECCLRPNYSVTEIFHSGKENIFSENVCQERALPAFQLQEICKTDSYKCQMPV